MASGRSLCRVAAWASAALLGLLGRERVQRPFLLDLLLGEPAGLRERPRQHSLRLTAAPTCFDAGREARGGEPGRGL
jgi:hypothetical protein